MKLKEHKTLWAVLICAVVLVLVPVVRQYVFGLPARVLMQAQGGQGEGQAPADAGNAPDSVARQMPSLTPASGESEYTAYGYYPEDGWTEDNSGFFVTAGPQGRITMDVYYPFALTGDESGQVLVNGQWAADFRIAQDNASISFDAPANDCVFVETRCGYHRQPENPEDLRRLAFVVLGVYAP